MIRNRRQWIGLFYLLDTFRPISRNVKSGLSDFNAPRTIITTKFVPRLN